MKPQRSDVLAILVAVAIGVIVIFCLFGVTAQTAGLGVVLGIAFGFSFNYIRGLIRKIRKM